MFVFFYVIWVEGWGGREAEENQFILLENLKVLLTKNFVSKTNLFSGLFRMAATQIVVRAR